MSERNPTDVERILAGLNLLQLAVRTTIPAVVVKYTPATAVKNATVDVQPGIQSILVDGKIVTLPQVTSAPIAYPSGGGWALQWPLQPGDTGVLTVPDRSIDDWLRTGGPAPPADGRKHPLSDAIFEPKLRPDTSPIGGTLPRAMTLGREDGTAQLQLDDAGGIVVAASLSIKLGSDGATKAVARATDPTSSSAAMTTWAAAVETGLALIPFVPPTPFASAAGLPGGMGTIHTGSGKVTCDD